MDVDFAAAHIIPGHPKCGRMHGHNYKVEVCLEGDTLDQNGFLVDFGVVKSTLSKIVGGLDHTYLNDSVPKEHQPPSAENLASYIYSALRDKVPATLRVSVRVWETPSQWAEYQA